MTHPSEDAAPGTAGYDRAIRALRALSPVVTSRVGSVLFEEGSKISEGVRGRRNAAASLVEWGRLRRDPKRSLVWFHAPSVGEGLQARAVMEALLELRPELQLAFTFFSPSARSLAGRMPARVAGYLPWDTRDEMEPVLEALSPEVVVFTKTEVWPGLAAAATRRAIPTALVAATLPAEAGRLRWPARRILRPTFAGLTRLGAISHDDGERFSRLGVDEERVTVTGDPGIDSAAQRAEGADPAAPYLAPFGGFGEASSSRPTLVAGSTWSADEAVLIPGFIAARRVEPRLRMILAPHEPDPDHLDAIAARLRQEGVPARRLGEVEASGESEGIDVVLVDRVGVLAHLYTIGTFSCVGGGFHRHGLHSVLEPAAAALPTFFGPRHANSRAASDLIERGGARVVRTADEVAELLIDWTREESLRKEAGAAAFAYIAEHRGAALRSAELIDEMIRKSTTPRGSE